MENRKRGATDWLHLNHLIGSCCSFLFLGFTSCYIDRYCCFSLSDLNSSRSLSEHRIIFFNLINKGGIIFPLYPSGVTVMANLLNISIQGITQATLVQLSAHIFMFNIESIFSCIAKGSSFHQTCLSDDRFGKFYRIRNLRNWIPFILNYKCRFIALRCRYNNNIANTDRAIIRVGRN